MSFDCQAFLVEHVRTERESSMIGACGGKRLALIAVVFLLCAAGTTAGLVWIHRDDLPDHVVSYTPLSFGCSTQFVQATQTVAAACGNDLPGTNRLVLLNARDGAVQRQFDLGPHMPLGLAVARDSPYVVVLAGNSIAIVNAHTFRYRAVALPFTPMVVAGGYGSNEVIVGGGSANAGHPMVAIVNAARGTVTQRRPLTVATSGGTGQLVVDVPSRHLFVPVNGGVSMLDARSLQPLAYARTPLGDPDRLFVDEPHHTLYVSLLNSPVSTCVRPPCKSIGAFAVVAQQSGKVVQQRLVVPGTAAIVQAAMSASAHRLFAIDYAIGSGRRNVVYALDTRSGAVSTPITVDASPRIIALDDKRHRLFVATEKSLDIFDAASSRRLWSIALPSISSMAVDVASGAVAVDSLPTYQPPSSEPSNAVIRFLSDHLGQIASTRATRSGVFIIKLPAT